MSVNEQMNCCKAILNNLYKSYHKWVGQVPPKMGCSPKCWKEDGTDDVCFAPNEEGKLLLLEYEKKLHSKTEIRTY